MVIRYLLDTNVTSQLRTALYPDTDPHFAAWAKSDALAQAAISVITIHEMERGILQVARKDHAKADVYRTWLDTLLGMFSERLLPVTLETAMLAAAYHVPDPAPLADSLIGATAAERGLTVVTRNTVHFERFGVPLLNPWEFPTG